MLYAFATTPSIRDTSPQGKAFFVWLPLRGVVDAVDCGVVIYLFPLFRQHINLVCELCQIFIGHSLTTSCNCKQSFRRGNKSAEYSRSTFCSFLFLHAYAVRLYNNFACKQIVTSTAVWCNRIIAVFISDTIGKFIARLFLAMINKNNFRLFS